jgi:hypothetical protein
VPANTVCLDAVPQTTRSMAVESARSHGQWREIAVKLELHAECADHEIDGEDGRLDDQRSRALLGGFLPGQGGRSRSMDPSSR